MLVHGRDAAAGRRGVPGDRALGRRGVWQPADLGTVAEARGLIDAAVKALGRVDVLVNNAGVFQRKPALEMEEADWDALLDVNLKGAFFCAQAAARACSGGAAPSSTSARTPGGAAGSTRAPTTLPPRRPGLDHALAGPGAGPAPDPRQRPGARADHDRDGRHAGSTLGDLRIPSAATGTPDEVAATVVFLASDEASYVTGAILNLSGGLFSTGDAETVAS